MDQVNLNDLFLFYHVVEAGGFSAAARRLDIPKSTINRRVLQLEKQLGVNLILRNTHQFQVSHIGELYYRRCAAMVAEAEAAQQVIDLHSDAPRGVVRFSCPKELLDLYVGEMLVGFMAAYPDVRIDLESTNRKVDVIQERFDFAIRIRPWPLEDSDLIVRPFCHSRLMLVASPDLVGTPLTSLDDLKKLPSLSNEDGNHHWVLQHDVHGTVRVPHEPRLVTENIQVLKQAALAGLGVVAIPYIVIMDAMKDGRLISVLKDAQWKMSCGVIHAAYASRRGMLPAVAALLDWLGEGFKRSGIE